MRSRPCKAPGCGNVTGNLKYCSRTCAARVNNARYPKRVSTASAATRKGYKLCWRCKTEYKTQLTSHGYCSIDCKHADLLDRLLPLLVENSNATRGHIKAQLLRLGLIEARCAICSITEWRGRPVPLVLDHINGKNNDHRLKNLRIVCRNCDGQLETFCRSNK